MTCLAFCKKRKAAVEVWAPKRELSCLNLLSEVSAIRIIKLSNIEIEKDTTSREYRQEEQCNRNAPKHNSDQVVAGSVTTGDALLKHSSRGRGCSVHECVVSKGDAGCIWLRLSRFDY